MRSVYRKGYLQVAEQDPFLPLSSSAGSSGRGGPGGSLSRPTLNPPQPYGNAPAGTYPGRHAHYRHTHTPPQTPPFPGTMQVYPSFFENKEIERGSLVDYATGNEF